MGTSKVSVDLNLRTFDIEVPDENVGHVLELLGHLFDKLPPSTSDIPASLDTTQTDPPEILSENIEVSAPKAKKKRQGGKGPAKVRAPELMDLGLTPQQRQDLQSFYATKAPKSQNDQVAVLGMKLKEYTQRSEFTVDEIHSAFKVVQKPTPKNLIAVFGNMKRDGRSGYADNKIQINSFTEDFVNFHMSKPEK